MSSALFRDPSRDGWLTRLSRLAQWLHRATWTQTELFLTFPPNLDTASNTDAPGLKAITLVPRNAPETGGRFRVWLMRPRPDSALRGWELVWDRKIEGGFPEMKALVSPHLENLDLVDFD